jgi:hypothetical protein
MLHLLAATSDRRDVALLWNNIIHTTAEVLPCTACKIHLQNYLRSRSFMYTPQIHLKTGHDVKTQIVHELWVLHNAVNLRLGKTIFSETDLISAYSGHRDTLLIEAKSLFEELKTMWEPQVFQTIQGYNFKNWIKSINLLIALLIGGPN